MLGPGADIVGLMIDEDVLTGRQQNARVDPSFHHLRVLISPRNRGLRDYLGAGVRRFDPFDPSSADFDE